MRKLFLHSSFSPLFFLFFDLYGFIIIYIYIFVKPYLFLMISIKFQFF
ncbi:hypothetical protein ANHYDRO_01947 [Anaerococcus hydrogenalis DSM 7454]|uniref:Uncharacterized protein n=1 Tax=Anaerococcus hydrogenalis DSM 7454 TaxID=561177 RepID=B6WBG5_9FIRM|nr:hypothetical protein ANHYDRO_01947 [Anaerococcus hydrogenalis DSM 7454]